MSNYGTSTYGTATYAPLAGSVGALILNELGERFVEDVPAFLQDQSDIVAIFHAQSSEFARLYARVDSLVREFLPTTATAAGLPLLELLVNVTVSPALSEAERRAILLTSFNSLRSTPEGSDFEDTLTRLVGPGWTYKEHDPESPNAAPPPYSVLISVPFRSFSPQFKRAQNLIGITAPAHLDVLISSVDGVFALDRDALDLGRF